MVKTLPSGEDASFAFLSSGAEDAA